MTTYEPTQIRKVLKAELAAYIEHALELARSAPATYEGSLEKTGRTEFVVLSINEGLTRLIELSSEGWKLDDGVPNLVQAPGVPLSITMFCPDEVFESYKPLIAERAEKRFIQEIEAHNKRARQLAEREAFVESEILRLEEERRAELRAELLQQYDNNKHPLFSNPDGNEIVIGRGSRGLR